MKLLFILTVAAALTACGGNSTDETTDTSSIVTGPSSGASMNTDITSVIGSNHIGEGQMRTDTPMQGSNVGK